MSTDESSLAAAKKFLRQAAQLNLKVDSKIEQLLRLQELAKKITSVVNGVPAANANSKLEKAVADVQEQSIHLSDEISLMLKTRAEIVAAIAQIPNPTERAVLEYRYLAFKTWRAIARSMNISVQHVFRIHRDALKNFSATHETK